MDNSLLLGEIYEDSLRVIGSTETATIGDVKVIIGGKKYFGQVLLYLADLYKYDMVVFFLLKEMFGIEYPMVLGITHFQIPYIAVKREFVRDIEEKDYYPHTNENLFTRWHLMKLIYVCRLIGCHLSLSDIRMRNGYPHVWLCNSLGNPRPRTITNAEFEKIFGISSEKAKDGNYTPLIRHLIHDLREYSLDTDELRGILYLRDQEMRYAKGERVRYPLTKRPREIENTIEENWHILDSKRPFSLFFRSIK